LIRDLALGPAEFPAMITSAEVKQTKAGENYCVIECRDKSASIKLMVWQWDARDRAMPKPGNILSVDGVVEEYQGRRQVKVSDFGYLAPQQVKMEDFLPCSARPAEEMHAELVQKVQDRIKSDPLRAMLLDMIQDEKIKAALLISPAATKMHHARRGGLMEHALSLWGLAEGVSAHYGALVNSDLLLSYCVLHDLMKTKEISPDAGFAYTKMGSLVGHVIMGAHLTFGYTRKHKVPEDLTVKLLHGISSHHGEWGEMQPKTIEAVIFHHLDQIDAKTEAIRTAFEEDASGAEKVNVAALKGDAYR
jgi:3'-5' exoribonuclease